MKIKKDLFGVFSKDISLYYGKEDNGNDNFCGRPIVGENEVFRDFVKEMITSNVTKTLLFSGTYYDNCKKIKGRLASFIKELPDCQFMVCMMKQGFAETVLIRKTKELLDIVALDEVRRCVWDKVRHNLSNKIVSKIDEDFYGKYDTLVFDEGQITINSELKDDPFPEFEDAITIALSGVLLFFFAEVQTLELNATRKRGHLQNCKYLNESGTNITVLDSTWFTTLVQSEGFKVRGHFRLQPYGEGMKHRKLIWIADFEKEGYVRKAGILKDNQ